ncbi:serine/threonine-protein kinase 17A [Spea bombifrons]|uniref:serine/threonine-protein kinase 17A n=1 Tax=Spea bombifrons TaxID=233779 RepID=UPI002349364D|nr:serine/threonine-protein kinase 17A [Spea bombifrons]XP_053323058.1 serine/threonine-protein kinase 17A [Spea bombifrons]
MIPEENYGLLDQRCRTPRTVRRQQEGDEKVQERPGLLGEPNIPIQTQPFTNKYRISPGHELGRGKFAVVRKCVEKETDKEYAAKIMRKRRKGEDCRMEILHEIAVLELAKESPWVIKLHEVYETASEMILVLEFAAGGEIFNQCVAEREEAFKEKDVQRLMRQILKGVSFLHRHNVVHLDLKPQNILLTSSCPLGDIKIVDFGLSRVVNNNKELREIMGTPEYVAPEILSYEPICTATDMWSIGVLAYVMLTGTSPFLGDDKQQTFLNISQLNISYMDGEFDGISETAIDFIKSLLVREPEGRSTADDCLQHPWLAQGDLPDPYASAMNTVPENKPQNIPPEQQQEEEEEEEEEQILTETPSEICPIQPEIEGQTVTEELIVMASYTLGQCRQTEMEKQTETKAITKRFKFEEPILQELPGECIY